MCIEFIFCSSILQHCDHSVGDFLGPITCFCLTWFWKINGVMWKSWSCFQLLLDMILKDTRYCVKTLVLFPASVDMILEDKRCNVKILVPVPASVDMIWTIYDRYRLNIMLKEWVRISACIGSYFTYRSPINMYNLTGLQSITWGPEP